MKAELAKYKGKWSVYLTGSKTYEFVGKGKRFCKNKVNELNNLNV